MSMIFAQTLRQLRAEKGLSQQQLAGQLFVDRSTIAGWETGRRVPDVVLIYRISEALGVDVGILLGAAESSAETPIVIMVDDEKVILSGGLSVLEEALPGATIVGFSKPSDAVAFAKENHVALAFLDIEMGRISGLDLCQKLLDVNHRTNVVFLTAYMEYSFEAWKTGACGFMMKPLTVEAVKRQLTRLRFPIAGSPGED